MREHRWESVSPLSFDEILAVTARLRQKGVTSMHPEKEMITYIEEWEVSDNRAYVCPYHQILPVFL